MIKFPTTHPVVAPAPEIVPEVPKVKVLVDVVILPAVKLRAPFTVTLAANVEVLVPVIFRVKLPLTVVAPLNDLLLLAPLKVRFL